MRDHQVSVALARDCRHAVLVCCASVLLVRARASSRPAWHGMAWALALTPHPSSTQPHRSDATFGVRVGTDELDRLWNLTEDNLSCERGCVLRWHC